MKKLGFVLSTRLFAVTAVTAVTPVNSVKSKKWKEVSSL
jgi:hypothetical protein